MKRPLNTTRIPSTLHLRQLRFTLLAGITLLFLTSCGFHLRSHFDLPQHLRVMHLQPYHPYSQFTIALHQNLTTMGVRLLPNASPQVVTLKINATRRWHDQPTLGPSNQARIYTFYFKVHFILLNSHGQPLIPEQIILVSRHLQLDPNVELNSNDQQLVLQRFLEREAIHQLLYRLTSQQIKRKTRV